MKNLRTGVTPIRSIANIGGGFAEMVRRIWGWKDGDPRMTADDSDNWRQAKNMFDDHVSFLFLDMNFAIFCFTIYLILVSLELVTNSDNFLNC